MTKEQEKHVIKKYPNRRLYDTWSSRYITLSDVAQMIREGDDIVVLDTQSNEDLTRSILVQIIVEQESSDDPLFTQDMLMDFIRSYDDTSRSMFTEFFEKNMEWFRAQQESFHSQFGTSMGADAMKNMTEIAEKNMQIWQDMQDSFFEATGLKSPKK
jgi:polyhydroxyalkanoate synthesis repressor PhaR